MKVAYVYIGESKLPKYVLENLVNTKSKFPNIDIVFISDNSHSLKKVSELGISVWHCKNQAIENSDTLNSMSHPMQFRSGYWFSTLARFFAIEEFMEHNSETEVLQIETDVWLSKNFPFDKFTDFTNELSYPMESVGRGAASVLYVGSLKSIKDFNLFCKQELLKDANFTDMTLLGKYLEEYSMRVVPLPTARDTSIFKEFTPKDLALSSSSSYPFFNGVFDPLSYGMHLFGVDARNSRGVLKLYSDTPSQILDFAKIEFEVLGQEVIARNNLQSFQIYNLHIHSKNLRIFRNASSMNEIHKLISARKNHEVTRIVLSVFFRAIMGKVRRWFTQLG